jgi:hypothetical protein
MISEKQYKQLLTRVRKLEKLVAMYEEYFYQRTIRLGNKAARKLDAMARSGKCTGI